MKGEYIISKLKELFLKGFEKFNQLNNKQLSLLISLGVTLLLILVLINIKLSKSIQKDILYELSFDEKVLEEVIKDEKIPLTKLETHKAYNKAAKSTYAKEIRAFKSLEELRAENFRKSAETLNEVSLEQQPEPQKKQPIKETEKTIKKGIKEHTNIKRKTTISYSLANRMHLVLPNPVYRCESFGKVVIDIDVNAHGKVVRTAYNRKLSNTTNGCLIENAEQYARQALFQSKAGLRKQSGTVTYLFQGG